MSWFFLSFSRLVFFLILGTHSFPHTPPVADEGQRFRSWNSLTSEKVHIPRQPSVDGKLSDRYRLEPLEFAPAGAGWWKTGLTWAINKRPWIQWRATWTDPPGRRTEPSSRTSLRSARSDDEDGQQTRARGTFGSYNAALSMTSPTFVAQRTRPHTASLFSLRIAYVTARTDAPVYFL